MHGSAVRGLAELGCGPEGWPVAVVHPPCGVVGRDTELLGHGNVDGRSEEGDVDRFRRPERQELLFRTTHGRQRLVSNQWRPGRESRSIAKRLSVPKLVGFC